MVKGKRVLQYWQSFFTVLEKQDVRVDGNGNRNKDNRVKGKKIVLSFLLFIIFFLLFWPSFTEAVCFRHPLDSTGWYLSQDFGVWNSDWDGYHLGEDYIINDGSELPVYATADGVVKHVNTHTGYGYVVIIEHDLGNSNYVCSVYGHLRQNGLIGLGDSLNISVKKGQQIGYLSSNSSENGGYNFTHLHFGIRSGAYSTALDPDGQWRYRGYASSTSIKDLWYDPTNYIATNSCTTALRVLILSTRYADTEQLVLVEQIRYHFDAVKSLINELSFGEADISFTFGDIDPINQKPETLSEWSQTATVLNKVFYNVHPDGAAINCDLNEIAPLAQQYLDGLSDDERRRSGILISTLNLDYIKQGIDPCVCRIIAEFAVRNAAIPTQYNLDNYDTVLFSIYDDNVHSGGLSTQLTRYMRIWQNGQIIDRPDKRAILVGTIPLNMNNYFDWLHDDYVPISQYNYYTQNQQPLSKYARTIAHELMHVFGAGHDYGINFYTDPALANQINANPALAYRYNVLEYGDWFSIAGSADYKYALGLAAPTRDLLGWLTIDRMHIVESTTQSINIQDINSMTGKRAAKVRVNGGWIYATYHAGTGYEEILKRPELLDNTRGLQLRFSSDDVKESVLLDPDGNPQNHDFSLKTGESFAVLGVKFANVQIDTNGLSFSVTISGPTISNRCDFNGDGKTDVAAFHLPSDQFFTDYAGNLGQYGWGGSDCYPLIWDYDGDGKTEVSIYHIPTNQWFVKGYPGDNLGQFGWGGSDSVPVPGDYNGDGVMERAFYHSPTNRWFVEGQDPVQFGWNGAECIPVPGDYDGDGKTDMALYHIPSNQWFQYGVGNLGQFGWGGADCIPVPGDYNGDGITDIAVYHVPTNQWFVKGIGNLGQYGWGGLESFPIPGDYDGDGVMERGFYRPSNNWWFIEGEPDFYWGWDGENFIPITSQIAVYNWFRFVLGRFQ